MANRSAQSRNHARGVNVGSSGLLCIRRGSNSSAENAARQEGQQNLASPVPPEILTLWLVVRFLSTWLRELSQVGEYATTEPLTLTKARSMD
jgi:hypothetical protein